MKKGKAPASITALACSDVPDDMFVRTQAASICSEGDSSLCRNSIFCGNRRFQKVVEDKVATYYALLLFVSLGNHTRRKWVD